MSSVAFEAETWSELGIGFVVVFLRVWARWKTVGVRNFRLDDYLVVLVLGFWAATCWIGVVVNNHGSISSLSIDDIANLQPSEKAGIELGSKLNLVSWIFYVCSIWSAKTCLLSYYNSFSKGLLHQERLIKITACLLLASFITVVVVILSHCSPIQNNWRVDQAPSYDCQYGYTNLYATMSCHLLTDLFLLAIPMPLLSVLSEIHLSLGRKILLVLCVCTGTFTIAAAITSFVESIDVQNQTGSGILWGNREEFVWIVFLNTPSIASIFRTEFWSHKAKSGNIIKV